MLSPLRRLIRLPRTSRTIAAEVDDEIAFHLAATERELIAAGMPPDQARTEALRRFGDVDAVRRRLGTMDRRYAWSQRWREWGRGLAADLSRSVRALAREPGFVAIVAVTLALGMGANATMFRVVDRLLLRPPAHVRDDGSLALLYFRRVTPEFGTITGASQSYPAFEAIRAAGATFRDVAAWWPSDMSLGTGAAARPARVTLVTPNFFSLLGVAPDGGRFFTSDAWEPQAVPTAVVTHAFATRELGGPSAALGRTLDLGTSRYTVIGVTPPGFVGAVPRPADVFVTMADAAAEVLRSDWRTYPSSRWLRMTARLRDGVTTDQASAAATSALQAHVRATDGRDTTATVIAGSIIAARAPEGALQGRIALWLGAVSALVLVVACANVANLLLARALRRRREFAVHLALGIPRVRLMSVVVGEALVLGAIGGALAFLVAAWSDRLLRLTLLRDYAWEGGVVDGRLAAFMALLVVIVGLGAGVFPALSAARTRVIESLKTGVREGGGRRSRVRSTLMVVQSTLSVLLLVGAGLFVHSFRAASRVELGFAPDGLITATPDLRSVTTDDARYEGSWSEIVERVRALPGVVGATQSVTTPFESQWQNDIYLTPGVRLPPLKGGGPYVNGVSPEYFTVMQTPVLRGRGFTAADNGDAPHVAVVSESMARQLWPGREALGECFRISADVSAPCITVVGITGDGRTSSLNDAPPGLYFLPVAQWKPAMRSLFVRVDDITPAALEGVRRAVLSVEAGLPYVEVRPVASIIEQEVRPWKLGATMFGLFAVLGLVVAAVGLYSVVAHDVTQRSREIGVRVALGARRRNVLALIVRDGMRQAFLGLAAGLALAWWASARLADLLFETSPREPVIYVTVAVLLVAVAFAALLSPASRAARVDPAEVLRSGD